VFAKAVVHHRNAFSDLAWEKSILPSKICYAALERRCGFIDSPEFVKVNKLSVDDE